MDISTWSFDRIMQLPDYMFGRRWPVTCTVALDLVQPNWGISNFPLPERFVIWGVYFVAPIAFTDSVSVDLRLGDVLPTTTPQFRTYETIFPGFDHYSEGLGYWVLGMLSGFELFGLRQPVQSMGRRLVVEADRVVGTAAGVTVVLVISSIPRSVPEWLNLV